MDHHPSDAVVDFDKGCADGEASALEVRQVRED